MLDQLKIFVVTKMLSEFNKMDSNQIFYSKVIVIEMFQTAVEYIPWTISLPCSSESNRLRSDVPKSSEINELILV